MWLNTVKWVAIAVTVIVLAGVFLTVWNSPSTVTGIVSAPVNYGKDVIQTVRGQHKHDLDLNRPLDDEEEHAAVSLGIDSEGEIGNFRTEVINELMDLILRQKQQNVGFAEGFRKAYVWVPLDWDHQRNVPLTTRITTGWVDRRLDRTRKLVPPDILKLARGIVAQKRGKTPDPSKCALHIVRPMDHTLTAHSGELKARDVIRAEMKPDPILSKKGFRTEFYCRPQDFQKLQKN